MHKSLLKTGYSAGQVSDMHVYQINKLFFTKLKSLYRIQKRKIDINVQAVVS